MADKVLVVDLDGTLYRRNTFHQFLKYLFFRYLSEFKLLKLTKLKFYIWLRIVRIISHKFLKYKVLKLVNSNDIDVDGFLETIAKYKREIPELTNRTFSLKILATAAPELYADAIASTNNFDACLATKQPSSDYSRFTENIKANKLERINNYLNTKKLNSIDTVITDHIDDRYSIEKSRFTIVYSSDTRFLKWLNENLINFEKRNK